MVFKKIIPTCFWTKTDTDFIPFPNNTSLEYRNLLVECFFSLFSIKFKFVKKQNKKSFKNIVLFEFVLPRISF